MIYIELIETFIDLIFYKNNLCMYKWMLQWMLYAMIVIQNGRFQTSSQAATGAERGDYFCMYFHFSAWSTSMNREDRRPLELDAAVSELRA